MSDESWGGTVVAARPVTPRNEVVMCEAEYRTLPVRSRRQIVAEALVDASDYERASRLRWYLNDKGYVAGRTRRSEGPEHSIRLHRVVLGLAPGDPRQVDHINGNKLDNRRANLRIVTNAQNHQNKTRRRRNNRSGVTGVSWYARDAKWKAAAKLDGRSYHLGYYAQLEDAARAVAEFRRAHMPFSSEARERSLRQLDPLAALPQIGAPNPEEAKQ